MLFFINSFHSNSLCKNYPCSLSHEKCGKILRQVKKCSKKYDIELVSILDTFG